MNAEKLKSTVVPILQSHGVTRASLFGSAARGDTRSDSDIDMAVEIRGDMSLLQFVGLQQLLEEQLGKKVDLVEYETIKPVLKNKILRESTPLL